MRLVAGSLIVFMMLAFMPATSFAKEAQAKNFSNKAAASTNARSSPRGNPAGQWLSYYKGETSDSFETIARFITKYPDFPSLDKLRVAAEKAMPSSIGDAAALDWFSNNPPQTAFGMKMYADALKRAGREIEARKAINNWWRETALTPSDQSKGYMAFATVLDKDAHEDRLRTLIYRQQYTNARSLAEALGHGYSALTEARISLRSGKGNPNSYIARIPSSLMDDEGLMFDRLRARRKADSNAGAMEILAKTPSYAEMYDAEEWGKERGIIVRRLFEEQKYGMAYRLSADHKIKSGPGFAANEWMAGWLALEYLKKPWDAFEHFERLYHGVETPISKSRAAYWAGRSSERLGHPEVARKWFEVGAQHTTTFYGQLSSLKLGREDRVRTVSAPASAGIKGSALASGARWLRQNGYKAEASLFLNQIIKISKTPSDFAAAAEVANEISMKHVAIKAAQECEKITGTAMVGYAFPRIEKYMNNADVEWALVHALVRQESRYDPDAVSSAGARGLMQLMPATAREVAQKAGLSHQTDWLTKKPAHNVVLGTKYLDQLLRRYDGNYAMALAAYNAGPGRVSQWVKEIGDPRQKNVDLVNWIEMIPIYETRNYVQRVLEGVYVYRQTLSTNKGRADGGIRLALQ